MGNEQNKGRKQLVLVVTFFVAPIILAIIMYNLVPDGGPEKTKNHGDLVIPARPLLDVPLQTDAGKEYKFSDMNKTWVMIYIGEASCDKTCTDVLYKMRQSRLAQRGEHLRIKRLYISTQGKANETLSKVLKIHPGLEVVYANAKKVELVLKQFELKNKPDAKLAKRLYLVDPFGNLMMSYDQGFDAKGLIKDMTLLLKVSRIG